MTMSGMIEKIGLTSRVKRAFARSVTHLFKLCAIGSVELERFR